MLLEPLSSYERIIGMNNVELRNQRYHRKTPSPAELFLSFLEGLDILESCLFLTLE